MQALAVHGEYTGAQLEDEIQLTNSALRTSVRKQALPFTRRGTKKNAVLFFPFNVGEEAVNSGYRPSLDVEQGVTRLLWALDLPAGRTLVALVRALVTDLLQRSVEMAELSCVVRSFWADESKRRLVILAYGALRLRQVIQLPSLDVLLHQVE